MLFISRVLASYDSRVSQREKTLFWTFACRYERITVKENAGNIVSSIHRQDRANQFQIPKSAHDILEFLGDTADAEYPVFRTPNEKDGGCTIATALFDLKEMTMSVYRDNPKVSSPLLVLPIPRSF